MNTHEFLRVLKEKYSIGEIIDALIDAEEIDEEDDELNDWMIAMLDPISQKDVLWVLENTISTWD